MMVEFSQKESSEKILGLHDDEAVAAFKHWSRTQATDIARGMQLKLTDEHWQVIDFIRTHFANTGEFRHARELSEVLADRFADEGGAKYLYRLFPGGPVTQGCQLAGIPVPRDASDGSFGYKV